MDLVAWCGEPGAVARDIALAIRDPEALAAVAALAADPDAPVVARVVALGAIVDACALRDLAPPDDLAGALDDLALVDAAVTLGRSVAVCAALTLLGAHPELVTTRRRVVRRLLARGVVGLPLGLLALRLGDVTVGVGLVARDYHAHIAPRIGQPAPDALVAAWLAVVAGLPAAARVATWRGLALGAAPRAELLAHARPEIAAQLAVGD